MVSHGGSGYAVRSRLIRVHAGREIFFAILCPFSRSVYASIDEWHKRKESVMPVEDQVIQCVETWANAHVDRLSQLLCDLWLKSHTACDGPVFQLLLGKIRPAFPNRKIKLAPSDFVGDNASVKSVQDLADAVQTSETIEV
jgi:hypothetical protein